MRLLTSDINYEGSLRVDRYRQKLATELVETWIVRQVFVTLLFEEGF